ncbi:hypothetical protein F7725_017898 [Dissostichus mawsoni]|uniref:Uncharacterized protein n=1 Tax=Dissostichus mawsoni TaxID=36200 RepID=A0A7J5XQH3_DISMA|nr:hypothetical protein F7725_017898 [Dissostichus mawsoni]
MSPPCQGTAGCFCTTCRFGVIVVSLVKGSEFDLLRRESYPSARRSAGLGSEQNEKVSEDSGGKIATLTLHACLDDTSVM